MEELIRIYNLAILGTKNKHPELDMGKQILEAIKEYLNNYSNNSSLDHFCHYFSIQDVVYGDNLRKNLYEYGTKNNVNIVLGFLDILYNFCTMYGDKNDTTNHYCDEYNKLVGNNKSLEQVKDGVLKQKTDLLNLLKDGEKIINLYINGINKKNYYEFDSIEIIDVTKSGLKVLINNDVKSIKNSYSGILLNGDITLASDRGYIDNPNKPQQDSVLSNYKSEDCFINVVADGAGGSFFGEKASSFITNELNNWFNSISLEEFLMLGKDEIIKRLNKKIIEINNHLVDTYKGRSYSTVVIALTIGDYTIIENVGDSTAYSYDSDSDELILLSEIDSHTKYLKYEDARHNELNNLITRAIGSDIIEDESYIHVNIIPNAIGKIILSSDGVTDLISEERFKGFFKEDIDASSIVSDAVLNPSIDDVIKEIKVSDNVSAIVIDLNKTKTKSLRRS